MDPGTLTSLAQRKQALIERAAQQRTTLAGQMRDVSRSLGIIEGVLAVAMLAKCVAAGVFALRFMRSSKTKSSPPNWMQTAVTVIGISRRLADFVGLLRRRKAARPR
jgi:hypothetical protein